MNRTQNLKKNSLMSLLSQLVISTSGLILPRLIISNYGAETHGLVNSISEFLGIITFLDLGVGSVVKSALYRPLAQKDHNQISKVIIVANNYFRKIAILLVVYVVGLIVFYPLIIDSNYSYLATVFLISALSVSRFGQYYFGIINELLLSANQQDYVQLGSEIVVVILNFFMSVVLIHLGASIQIVKLVSGLIYLARPLYLKFYVEKQFNINYEINIDVNPLPQRWHGIGHHIANAIQNNTDIIILTFFTSLEKISIYSIYNMIVRAVRMIVSSLTLGMQAFFGNLYANDEIKLLNNYFDRIEWLVHTGVIYLYGMTLVLIRPFIELYTSDITGISYDAPLFSIILVLSSATHSLRTPYGAMVLSAGHFKQTQMSAFIEAGLNLFISIILVSKYGLVGVAVGTLVSMTYRTLYLVLYLSKNIINRPIRKFLKHVVVDAISLGVIGLTGTIFSEMNTIGTISEWVLIATFLGVINLIIIGSINFIFYKEIMITTIKKH